MSAKKKPVKAAAASSVFNIFSSAASSSKKKDESDEESGSGSDDDKKSDKKKGKKSGDGDDDDAPADDDVVNLDPMDSLKALLFNETLADVHFLVGGGKEQKSQPQERIPAHRLILSAGNAVLRAMLYPLVIAADGKSAKYSPAGAEADIVIDDVSPAAFKKMLTSIYTDECEVTPDDVTELIALAKRFSVDSLKSICVEFMEQDVSAEKACTLFVEGRKLLNEPAFGLSFIEENIEDIVKTDGFFDLPRDCLEAILRSGKLLIDEADLWVSVDKWAAAECKRNGKKTDGPSKREVLGTALNLIRFPLIEMQDLCMKVQPANVLSQEELLSLFTYSAAPEDAKPRITFSAREREGGGNKIQIHDFNWSAKLSNGARCRAEGPKLVSTAPTCNRDVLGIADTKGWSRGIHYWRLSTVSGGCYRRVGVVDGEFDKTKYGDGSPQNGLPAVLGSTANSWGANVVSAHNYGEPNVSSAGCGRFASGEVGILLDLNKKSMHLYSNGQFVCTAFTNIKGKKLRPSVQICHNASFVTVVPAKGTQMPVLPK